MDGMDATRLHTVVDSLGKTDRLILMLYYAERLSVEEIAHVLDLSQPEVSQRLTHLQSVVRDRLLGGTGVTATAARR